jgi:type I restriction enzyme S subunit
MTPFSRHTQLKPSGASWLGDIPSHWDVKPLWAVYRPKKDTGHPEETLLSVYRDYGVIKKSSRDDNKNRASEDLSGYQLVANGDLVTNKMKTWQGSIAVSGIQGIVSPAYYVYRKRHSGNDAFFHHLFRSVPYISGYQSISKGIRVGQWDLEADKFRLFPVLLPPLAEQDSIVSHLDRATTRIDALVAKKTRFIELLREKRQAEITHGVTKGLDVGAPMKDSGAEWLGKVPAHWVVSKLAYVASEQGGKTPTTAVEAYWDGDIPWVTPKDMKSSLINNSIDKITEAAISGFGMTLVAPGAILVVVRGMILAHSFPIAELMVPATINQDMKALIPVAGLAARYLRYLLESYKAYVVSMAVAEAAHGTRVLRTDVWRLLPVLLPTADEQRNIIEHLDRTTSRIDTLICKIERSIELLRERRTALSTAAVTGRIDLRNAA